MEQTLASKRQKLGDLDKRIKEKESVIKVYKSLLPASVDEYNSALASLRRLRDDRGILARSIDRQADLEQYEEEILDLSIYDAKINIATWNGKNRKDKFAAYPYQIEGATHFASVKRGLLGDKRGLGKTLTSLAYLDLVQAKRVMYIAPSDALDNLIREVKLWTPHFHPIKIGNQPRDMREFVFDAVSGIDNFFLAGNYEMWRRDKNVIPRLASLGIDTVVMDEAHRIKDTGSLFYRGSRDIVFAMNKCPKCPLPNVAKHPSKASRAQCKTCGYWGDIYEFSTVENVLCMTGTPILNRPQELFPMMHLIDPMKWETEKNYVRDFCKKTVSGRWGWQEGADKRVVKEIGPRYLARDRDKAGIKIPPAQHILHEIEMAEMEQDYPAQFKAYKDARDAAQLIMDEMQGDDVMLIGQTITLLLRLRQVLTWPNAIKMNLRDGRELRLNVTESIKIDKAVGLIKDLNDEGERVVLFSQFSQPLHVMQSRLGDGTAIYDGSTGRSKRNEIQLDFDPKTVSKYPTWDNVMCNYKAAGEALNFNAARRMAILDAEWNPGRQSQAYGRIDRIGQTEGTFTHTFRVKDSVDSWLAELNEEKARVVDGFEESASIISDVRQALREGRI